MRNFWRESWQRPEWIHGAEASNIERTLSIGSFVKNYTPLMQNLMPGFSAGTYKTLQDLARLNLTGMGWHRERDGRAAQHRSGGNGDARGGIRQRGLHPRHPRVSDGGALQPHRCGNLVPQAQQPPLMQFFSNNPSLELIKDNVAGLPAGQGEKAFTGINEEDQATVMANAAQLPARAARGAGRGCGADAAWARRHFGHADCHDGRAAVFREGNRGRAHQTGGQPVLTGGRAALCSAGFDLHAVEQRLAGRVAEGDGSDTRTRSRRLRRRCAPIRR